MKTPTKLVLILGLTLLTSLALPATFATPQGTPAGSGEKRKALADLPMDARKAIGDALKREKVLAPEELTEDAKLAASNGDGNFGVSVAIEGDTIVVGGQGAYVFLKPPGGWADGVEMAKLTASDGAALGDSVAVAGDTLVVGAYTNEIGGNLYQGSVYVFVRPTGGWAGSVTESAKLLASDGGIGDALGYSVTISGNTVVGGAPSGRGVGTANAGSAYIFLKPAGGWAGSLTESAKLTASDGAPTGGGDAFGYSVGIAGDTVVIGALGHEVAGTLSGGQAYIFVKPANGWAGTLTENAKLIASDGEEGDNLGVAVAIAEDTVVAGASGVDIGGVRYQGAAYVFTKPTSGWTGTIKESAKLIASSPQNGDFMGFSVAIEGDTVVAGAPSDSQEGERGSGITYLFAKPAGGWSGTLTENDILLSSEGIYETFGWSVAISNSVTLVGAFSTSNGASGAAYVFEGAPPMARNLMADADSPMFSPEGSFADNTIELENPATDGLLHLEGGATITPDGSNQAQITIAGTYEALAGDIFSLAYSFSVDLNTDAPASYALAGSVTVDGVPVPFDAGGALLPGLHKYEGTAQTIPFPADGSGDFTATLTLDFGSNAAPLTAEPGTLVLAIQQLDFQLGPDAAVLQAPSQSQNISTRADVGTGDHVLIGGFIVDGTDPKLVVLRAIGPSLADLGVTGVLADPVLELHDSTGATVATNDNWMDLNADDQTTLTDNLLAPGEDLESALVMTLDPGAYTAIVSGAGATTGVALVEAYDLDNGATDSRLANISTRGFVATADSVMIGGFIVGGGGGGFSSVIVRGLGPSLSGSGVLDALADPTLEVHNGNGDLIDSNDNWMSDPNMQSVIDNNLAPSDPNEAALFEILPPGLYTAILAGAGDSTGVGLVETYDID